MRADQLERMRKVQEEVADVFFAESDIKDWPGDGKKPKELSVQERGDRYWSKKNAAASLSLIVRIENLLALRDGRSSGGPKQPDIKDDEKNLDQDIEAAEREAAQLVERLKGRRRSGAPAGR